MNHRVVKISFTLGIILYLTTPLSHSSDLTYLYVPTSLEASIGERHVRSLHFDTRGWTWVGTQSALLGISEAPASTSQGLAIQTHRLSPAEIIGVFESPNNSAIALSSDGRMLHLPGNPTGSVTGERVISETSIKHGILIPGTSTIWFVDRVGRLRNYTGVEGAVRTGSLESILPDDALTTKIVNSNAYGLCGGFGNKVLCNIDSEKDANAVIFRSEGEEQVRAIAVDSEKDTIFVVTSYSAIHTLPISGVGQSTEHSVPQLKNLNIRSANAYGDDLLLATDNGLYLFRSSNSGIEKIKTGRHSSFTDLVDDRTGIWALSEAGIAYIARTAVASWSPRTLAETLSFSHDGEAGYFVGTYDGVLHRPFGGTKHNSLWPPKTDLYADMRPVTALVSKGDTLYAGSFNNGLRVLKLDRNRRSASLINTLLPKQGITALLGFHDGILIGTSRSGLKYLSKDKIVDVRLPISWSRNPTPITSISSTDEKSILIVTTENQILLLCLGDPVFVCGEQSIKSTSKKPVFLASSVDEGGNVWLGTLNSGLLRTTIQNIQKGLPINRSNVGGTSQLSVFSVLMTTDMKFWLGTNDGLYFFNPTEPSLRRFGRVHGLVNSDFHHGAALTLLDERVLVGGPYGYNLFRRELIESKAEAPNVYVKSVTIEGQEFTGSAGLSDYSRIELEAANRGIRIVLSVNDLRRLGANKYQYKLDGLDMDWGKIGSANVARYMGLKPGNYVFRARGADALGTWSQNEIRLPISVGQERWQSWWAWLWYFIIALFVAGFIKKVNDKDVVSRQRLILVNETKAAYARLEDNYQEQVEVNEELLRSRGPAAKQALDVVETVISSCLSFPHRHSKETVGRVLNYIKTLHILHSLTDRTLGGEKTNMHAVSQEIVALLVSENRAASRSIIINEVTEAPLGTHHASYISLLIKECLEFTIDGREYEDEMEPIITLRLFKDGLDSHGPVLYTLELEDSSLPDESGFTLEDSLPITSRVINHFGGMLEQSYLRGNQIRVSLTLPPNEGM